MSVETDYRAMLLAFAPLFAIVGTNIAQDEIPPGSTGTVVVFTSTHTPDYGLDGTLLSDQVLLPTQIWADDDDAPAAAAAADQVEAAIVAANPVADVCVLSRAPISDPDNGLVGVELTVEWWA